MTQREYQVRPSFGSALVGLLVAALFFYLMFRLAAFTLSTLVSGLPVFFGIGLILLAVAYYVNPRIPKDFGQWLGLTFRQNPLKGLVLAAATVVFAPFVFGFLLAKALLLRRVSSAMGNFQARAEEAMRQQRPAGSAIGHEEPSPAGFTEVRRDDGLVIRIPKEEEV